MKKVIVFTTGGTIAMKYDAEKGGLVPAVSGADLAAAVPGLDKVADVEVREFSNVASCNMSPERMFALSHAIEEALKADDVAGAVVTHGTDTLEETSYLICCIRLKSRSALWEPCAGRLIRRLTVR